MAFKKAKDAQGAQKLRFSRNKNLGPGKRNAENLSKIFLEQETSYIITRDYNTRYFHDLSEY